jgi:6-phosphogluconate dehydrogenase
LSLSLGKKQMVKEDRDYFWKWTIQAIDQKCTLHVCWHNYEDRIYM